MNNGHRQHERKKLVKFERVVSEICARTNKHVHHDTPLAEAECRLAYYICSVITVNLHTCMAVVEYTRVLLASNFYLRYSILDY